MARFNDFSRYKNNELRSYFFRKEVREYLKKRERRIQKQANPFVSVIFSALIIITLWVTRGILIEKGIEEEPYSWKYYITNTLKVGAGFIFIFSLYNYLISPAIKHIFDFIDDLKFRRNSNLKFYLDEDDEMKLEIFNYEVVNQLSLALSLITHIDEDCSKEEMNMYTNEAFQYLKNSMTILSTKILNTGFAEKIGDPDYNFIRKSRVQSAVETGELVLKKISTKWGAQHPDIRLVHNTIERIVIQLSDINEDVL